MHEYLCKYEDNTKQEVKLRVLFFYIRFILNFILNCCLCCDLSFAESNVMLLLCSHTEAQCIPQVGRVERIDEAMTI